MFGRNKVAMLVAEFLGTGVLALVMLAVQRSTIGVPYFVAIAAGLAVAALMFVFSGVSGAHLNPAVTIGLWVSRKVKTLPAATYLVAQLLGGWAAYGVYTYLVNQSLPEVGGHFTLRILIAEAIGTFIFAFVWAAVAAKRLSVSVAGVGFALGIMVAAAGSIGVINPAVALSERAWNIWGSMGWGTYVAGPVIGGIVGVVLYEVFFTNSPLRAFATSSKAKVVVAPKPATKAKKTAAKKRK